MLGRRPRLLHGLLSARRITSDYVAFARRARPSLVPSASRAPGRAPGVLAGCLARGLRASEVRGARAEASLVLVLAARQLTPSGRPARQWAVGARQLLDHQRAGRRVRPVDPEDR